MAKGGEGMTREEVYDKCVEKFYPTPKAYEKGLCSVKYLLSREAIDAIIDCAVAEAIERVKNMTFATFDGQTGLPITKTNYVVNRNEIVSMVAEAEKESAKKI